LQDPPWIGIFPLVTGGGGGRRKSRYLRDEWETKKAKRENFWRGRSVTRNLETLKIEKRGSQKKRGETGLPVII